MFLICLLGNLNSLFVGGKNHFPSPLFCCSCWIEFVYWIWINWSMVPVAKKKKNQKQNVKKPKLLMVWICIWIGQKKEIRFDGTKSSYNQKEWSFCGEQYGILNESCSYSIWCVLDDGETYCCLQHRLCRSTIPVRLTDDESGWILSEMVMHAHTHREWEQETSQPTVRQCNFFPFRLHVVLLSIFCYQCVFRLLLLLLLLYAHRSQGVWSKQCDCAKYVRMNGAHGSV